MTIRDRFVQEIAEKLKSQLDIGMSPVDGAIFESGVKVGVGAVLDVLFSPNEDGFKVVEVELVPKISSDYISKFAHRGDQLYVEPDYSNGRPKIGNDLLADIWATVSS